MRKLLLATTLSMLAFSPIAATGIGNLPSEKTIGGTVSVNHPVRPTDGETTFTTKFNGMEVSAERIKADSRLLNATRADEGLTYYNVMPNIIKTEGLSAQPGLQYAVPVGGPIEDGMYLYACFAMDMGDEIMVFSPWRLPAGKYDFLTMTTGEDGVHCVIKDGIEVNEDMTIDFDMAEATNHIVFDAKMPDGKTPIPWMNWETLTESAPGNCAGGGVVLKIYHKNGHNVMTYISNLGAQSFDDDGNYSDSRTNYNIWTTDTDEFSFYQILDVVKQSGDSFIMPMFADGCATQTVSNDYENYQEITSSFEPSLFDPSTIPDDGVIYGGIAYGYTAYINNRWEGYSFDSCYGTMEPVFTSHISLPKPKGDIIKECFICPQNVYIQSTSGLGKYGIFAPTVRYDNNEWQYQTSFANQMEERSSMGDFAVGLRDYGYKFYDQYGMEPGENPVFGQSCPITLFVKTSRNIAYDFFGRFGENRSIDLLNHELTMKRNGRVVCDSWMKLQEMISNWEVPENWSNFANWDYEIVNKNMMVDGLQGMNRCVMRLEEDKQFSAPTVTHLQMRDADGRITDRLKTAEGSVYFSAGVWSTWEVIYSELAEAKLSYRPYGSEEWIEMDVKAEGELFLPAYGQLYTADASQIKERSETGWFDLRIEINDGKGNSQIQEVSPALKIESLSMSGVKEMDVIDSSSEVYDLNGLRVNPASGMQPGIYVVKRNGKTVKVKI